MELNSTRRMFLGGFAALAVWPENLWGAGAPRMPSLRRSVWERSDGNATDSVMAGHGEDLHNFCPVCGNKAYQTEKEGANH